MTEEYSSKDLDHLGIVSTMCDENPIITFGHSKDYRPDLKQFMISLICSQDGDVPLLAQTIAGNTSEFYKF